MKAELHSFSHAFTREVRNAWRKPVIHWLSWCFPLFLFVLISSDFSEGALLHLPVVAVDNDHSPLSHKLIRQLNAGSHASITRYQGDLPAAKAQMESTGAYALLWIPPDFEAHALAGKQPTVMLYYNALIFGAGFYATQDFAGLIADLNMHLSPILAAGSGQVASPSGQLSMTYDSLFNASGSYIYYQQFSAMIHLIQLFTVTCMIYVVSRSRPLIYQQHFIFALLGKLLPYTISFTVLLMAELALLVGFFDARMAGNPLMMLPVAFCYVMAAQSMGLLLYGLTSSAISAYTFTGMFVGVALTFSGTAIPTLSMTLPAQFFSRLQPLTHALAAMLDLFLRDIPVRPILSVCGVLLLYPLATALLLRKRLMRRLKQGEVPQ
ncbi:ABC transporter permease [Enterobacteriaceae bacterium LUAb1]